jgi:hypothetical protein
MSDAVEFAEVPELFERWLAGRPLAARKDALAEMTRLVDLRPALATDDFGIELRRQLEEDNLETRSALQSTLSLTGWCPPSS